MGNGAVVGGGVSGGHGGGFVGSASRFNALHLPSVNNIQGRSHGRPQLSFSFSSGGVASLCANGAGISRGNSARAGVRTPSHSHNQHHSSSSSNNAIHRHNGYAASQLAQGLLVQGGGGGGLGGGGLVDVGGHAYAIHHHHPHPHPPLHHCHHGHLGNSSSSHSFVHNGSGFLALEGIVDLGGYGLGGGGAERGVGSEKGVGGGGGGGRISQTPNSNIVAPGASRGTNTNTNTVHSPSFSALSSSGYSSHHGDTRHLGTVSLVVRG